MRCLTCQTENAEGAQFCMRCGTPLGSTLEKGPAERRQITVLFCDLVGSTALSEQLDPEDLREVIRGYHATCEAVVTRYDGSVAQHLGDGVLVYFGHPRAHEDDAERAVRAGLELREAVSRLTARDRPLAVRVGIHTGVVVVGAVGADGRQLALGATPNLAARIQQEADPGTVVISEASERLVSGLFHVEDLSLRAMRGMSQPMHLYRVERPTGVRSRMEAVAAATGLTPFTGREKELALLLQRWGEALNGRAPVLVVGGEPGIGKSRLVRRLRERVGSEATVIECYASPLFQDTALYPIVEMLERHIGSPKEPPSSRRAKLHAQLEQASRRTKEIVGPLEALLSIPPSDEAQTVNLSPQKQRQATFDALVSWLSALAEKKPTLFVFEDLHWADPSTIELLGMLIGRVDGGRLMMVLTHRPEFQCPFTWPRLVQLNLQRLPPDEARQILAAVTKESPLPETVEREIISKADGIPLYVEEIGKAVLETRRPKPRADSESPVSSRAGFAIPATVVDSLTARLDRLGEAKQIVQLAAILGRSFALGLLLEVAGMQETALRAKLDRLQAAGLVLREHGSADDRYTFKHALIQDAAYESLLRETRQQYHRQIARVLEEKSPTLATSQPELLARHFEGAGMTVEAIAHWALAGQQASARSANAEAINAFGNALRLLQTLPESEQRDRQEIDLRCGLGFALISAKGWSASEVEDAYGPALALCRRSGDIPSRVYYGIWAVYIVRSDRERIAELIPRAYQTLSTSRDPTELLGSHAMLAAQAFWTGDFSSAAKHGEVGASYIDRENPRKQAHELFALGYDGQIYPLIFKAWSDVIQARARNAAALSREYNDIAIASDYPFLLALALSCGAAVAHDMGDIELMEKRGQRLFEVASDNGLSFFSGNSLSFLGCAAFVKGDQQHGLRLLREAAEFYVAVGANMVSAYYLTWLAQACVRAGLLDEGLAAVNRGLEITKTKLSVFSEPELHRIHGDLQILKGEFQAGEQSLRRAYAIAERQAATLFEARALLSLGRLWASQGRGPEIGPTLRSCLSRIGVDEPIRERQDLVEMARQLSEGV